MSEKKLILLAAALSLTFWGCSSNLDSGGDQTGADNTLASAARVGMDNCLNCHNPGSTLLQDYMASRHGNRMLATIKMPQDALEVHQDDPRPDHCGFCHPTVDSDIIDYAYLSANQPAGTDWNTLEAGVPLIGCEDCHGGGQFHNGIPAGIPFPVPGPDQCGDCHYLNADIDNDEWAAEGEYPHHTSTRGSNTPNGDGVRRNILDSHVDNPATGYESSRLDATDPLFAPNVVEGYAIRYNQQNGCVDCHFLGHKMDLTKNYQWSESGHGGELKTIKDAVMAADLGMAVIPDDSVILADVTAAGADDANAFVHYDWDAENRQSCQMCHSATGFMNYVADPTNYNPANNDYSHLVGWSQAADGTVTSSGQNELLYCWGCHSDSDGNLRVTGAVTAVYTYNDAPVVFPDVGSSNTCVVCHSGRGNNENVATGSRFAAHHAPAAADLFSDFSHMAYEYPGLSYANVSFFAHPSIDVDGSGPCVACHMVRDNPNSTTDVPEINHTFFVVEKDASGVITGINGTICVTCHDGEHGLFVSTALVGTTQNIWDAGFGAAVPTIVTQMMADDAAAELEHESEGYQEAGALLNDYLNNTGGLQNYRSVAAGSNVKIDNNTSVIDNDLGAFQNAKLPGDEPGGFAHNRYYVKRALFDAIDWVDNGAINGTITVNAVTYPAGAAWFGADAVTGVATRP